MKFEERKFKWFTVENEENNYYIIGKKNLEQLGIITKLTKKWVLIPSQDDPLRENYWYSDCLKRYLFYFG